MENLDANLRENSTSFITTEISAYLMETAKWGKFLAVMGYIGTGLLVLLGVGVTLMGGAFSELFPGGAGGVNIGAVGLVYVALGALYFFPVYYLHQFSLKIKQGLTSQDSQDVTTGFQNLKSLFKFMGICAIVVLSIYALVFFIIIVFAFSEAM